MPRLICRQHFCLSTYPSAIRPTSSVTSNYFKRIKPCKFRDFIASYPLLAVCYLLTFYPIKSQVAQGLCKWRVPNEWMLLFPIQFLSLSFTFPVWLTECMAFLFAPCSVFHPFPFFWRISFSAISKSRARSLYQFAYYSIWELMHHQHK